MKGKATVSAALGKAHYDCRLHLCLHACIRARRNPPALARALRSQRDANKSDNTWRQQARKEQAIAYIATYSICNVRVCVCVVVFHAHLDELLQIHVRPAAT